MNKLTSKEAEHRQQESLVEAARERCRTCGGRGKLPVLKIGPGLEVVDELPCPDCKEKP